LFEIRINQFKNILSGIPSLHGLAKPQFIIYRVIIYVPGDIPYVRQRPLFHQVVMHNIHHILYAQ